MQYRYAIQIVNLSYAAVTACHFHFCFQVDQYCSCMLLCCHPVSIPCLCSCSFNIIRSARFIACCAVSICHSNMFIYRMQSPHVIPSSVSSRSVVFVHVLVLPFRFHSVLDFMLVCHNPQHPFAGTVDGKYSAPPSGATRVN